MGSIANTGSIKRFLESGCSSSWRQDQYSTKRVLPEKQCGTGRVPPERLARPISQACTRIAVQPEVQVLVSWRAHLQSVLKNLVQGGTSASQLERFSRAKTKIILKIKTKIKE